jgi:hypothetical protein
MHRIVSGFEKVCLCVYFAFSAVGSRFPVKRAAIVVAGKPQRSRV